jgi:cytochrome P450
LIIIELFRLDKLSTQLHTACMNVFDAASHSDPYPYYLQLRESAGCVWDETLNVWLLSSAQAVEVALSHAALRVRPPGEPVPVHLLGTPLADVFTRLIRMSDGALQQSTRALVKDRIPAFDSTLISSLVAQTCKELHGRSINDALRRLPVMVIGRLLGWSIADSQVDAVLAFIRALSPNALPEVVAQASDAVARLLANLGETDAVLATNCLGLMQQSSDACAALLGLVMKHSVAKAAHRQFMVGGTEATRCYVREIARWDAPIQNTRRWAVEPLQLCGHNIAQGQALVLLLASANRDSALNPLPDNFNPQRQQSRMLTFGSGTHSCIGEEIAINLVAACADFLWAGSRFDHKNWQSSRYLSLPNARIPVFEGELSW